MVVGTKHVTSLAKFVRTNTMNLDRTASYLKLASRSHADSIAFQDARTRIEIEIEIKSREPFRRLDSRIKL